jgi:hypothetical protein
MVTSPYNWTGRKTVNKQTKQDVVWNTNAPRTRQIPKAAIIVKTQDQSQDVKI